MECDDCFQDCLKGTREKAGDQRGGYCKDPGKWCRNESWICVHAGGRTQGSTENSDAGCEEKSKESFKDIWAALY